eukprot:scaffold7052_cov254-Pinguiococcus_pyrenoidosus.AAC.5
MESAAEAKYLGPGDEPWPGMRIPGSQRLPPTFVRGFHDESAVRKMLYSPLGQTGMVVSLLGIGTSAFGGFYEAFEEEEAKAAVLYALRCGVNFIDTAVWYGQGRAERILGDVLQEVPPQAYYIGTKACRYDRDVATMFDFSYVLGSRAWKRGVSPAVWMTGRLGHCRAWTRAWNACVSKLLMLFSAMGTPHAVSPKHNQVHDPEFADTIEQVLDEVLPALDQCRQEGKAKFVGVTGYPLSCQRYLHQQPSVVWIHRKTGT